MTDLPWDHPDADPVADINKVIREGRSVSFPLESWDPVAMGQAEQLARINDRVRKQPWTA